MKLTEIVGKSVFKIKANMNSDKIIWYKTDAWINSINIS